MVKAIVAAKFGDGMGGLKPKPQHVIKFRCDNHVPGGVGNLIGLIIGPRGKTRRRIQNETGTVLVVRGKGPQDGHWHDRRHGRGERASHHRA